MENIGSWNILWPFEIYYRRLVYYLYLAVFGYIFPVLVYCITKNLAALASRR
jgi:hypothetical protein